MEEAEAIARLVNAAYRPAGPTPAWTHEAHLISGPRVSASEVANLITRRNSLVLLVLAGADLAACVHLEKHGQDCRLGMFAVAPERQAQGIGKRLLDQAERHALEALACTRMQMIVLGPRSDLLAFYQRRGYQWTGKDQEYPRHGINGTPRIEGLRLRTLFKQLDRVKAAPQGDAT